MNEQLVELVTLISSGSLGDDDIDAQLVDASLTALSRGTSAVVELAGQQLFVETYPVRPRLVVVGAVEVAVALVRFARELDYEAIEPLPRLRRPIESPPDKRK